MLSRFKHLGSGILMGTAALFPGISAGTVALLLGIHDRLIRAVANVDHHLPQDLWRALRRDPASRSALQRLDPGFILAIIAGMLFITFSGARAVTWLQLNHPGPVMAAFLGLIAFGALIPWRRIRDPGWREGLWIVPGAMAAVALALAPEGSLGSGLGLFFLGGMVAMPMMILPGVSGSAMLVTLGLYADAFVAVSELDVPLLAMFALGGIVGLLASAKALKWLLDHHHGPTMAFLTGLLAGSAFRVWPWRTEDGFANGLPAAPDHHLWWLAWTVSAAAVVIALERYSAYMERRTEASTPQRTDDEPYQ